LLFVSKYAIVSRRAIQRGVALAYPNLYNITYSYTGFQQAQQGVSAFPGTQLDADLAGLSASLDGLATFVERGFRSDGALTNGSVTFDSLSPALQAGGISGSLPWTTGTPYGAGSTAINNNKLYRCLVAHTAGVFATDLAAGDWVFLANLGVSGPGSSVAGHVPTFSDASGVVLADSGAALASLAPLVGANLSALAGLGVRSSGAGAFDMRIVNSENLTTSRALTITLGDAPRTLTLNTNVGLTGGGSGTFPIWTLGTLSGAASATRAGSAAPSAPSAGGVTEWIDSTDLRVHDINAAGVIGTTVVANAGATHHFVTSISAAGVVSHAQPAVADISGAQAALTPGQLPGEPSNGSATAGNVGEYIESIVVTGSAVALTTATTANVTSIALTAGDWDVNLSAYFTSGSAASITQIISCISLVSATIDTTPGREAVLLQPATVPGAGTNSFHVPMYRLSISGNTTVFLVVRGTFTLGALSAFGIIRARRVR
jgi:hypothetical protein